MPNNLRALLAAAAVVCAVLSLALFAPMPAFAGSPNIVISQVYGGGGNSGATYKNDFVELFNRGASAVDVTGWTVQYASSAGTSWQKTNLSGTIEPGKYYLVQEAKGSGGTQDLPTPSATGTIAMSAIAGKVALVSNSIALSGSCPTAVVDFVGFGGANCFEGTGPTAVLSNTTAAFRAGDGTVDTDNNFADFSVAAPSPRTSASVTAVGAATPASVAVGETVLLTVRVAPGSNPPSTGIAVTTNLSSIGGSSNQPLFDDATNGDVTAADNTFSFLATIAAGTATGPLNLTANVTDAQARTASAAISFAVTPPPIQAPIHEIQGTGDISPYSGQLVQTTGIVTARKNNGFFIQTLDVDADPNTSEGIFVFTSSTPPDVATAGNLVSVRGTLSDYVPSADPLSPALTEISGSPTVSLISSGNSLPEPVIITAADLSPTGGILQLEKYEGMRVRVDSLTVTGPTQGTLNESAATSTSNGLFFGVLTGAARPFREPGIELPDLPPLPCCVPSFDANPERLRVDTRGQVGASAIDVTSGAVVTDITGVLDYGYRTYSIVTDPATPPGFGGNISAQPVPAPDAHQITIASANLERFFDTINDPDTSDAVLTPAAFYNRLNKVSLTVRTVLLLPDILGVEEVENLSVLQALADKINADAAATGPDPQYYPYLSEGNDSGGIDVGFLVKSSRIDVLDVTQEGKDTTYIDPKTGQPAMLNDRPSLVLRALVHATGKEVALPLTVIVNHLRSLNGVDDPADGFRVRAKRLAQAEFLANLIQSHQTGDPLENIVSVGDYNAFDVNDGFVDVMGIIRGTPAPADEDLLAPSDPALVTPPLTDLSTTLPSDQRYSYTYDGSAQMLDHVLANTAALTYFSRFTFARNNADFPEIYRNDPGRPEKYSDHDIPVAYFNVPLDTVPPVLTLPADITVIADNAAGSTVTFSATAFDAVDKTTTVTCSPASGATFPIGITTVSCSSTDQHDNTATGSFQVRVFYAFVGLKSTGVNPGSTIPVKFQLLDAHGRLITSPSAVQSIQAASNSDCVGDAEGTLFPALAAGGSTLRFDFTANQFVFNWKTERTWTGCYNILLGLDDGTTHSAIISFK